MSIPATCSECGHQFTSGAWKVINSTNFTFSGATESCPLCGGIANLQDGTYDFVGEVITAFRAPNITRQKIEALQQITKSVQSGKNDIATAKKEIEKLDPTFSTVFDWANDKAGALGLLLTIIGLFLAYYYWQDSKDSAQDALVVAQRQAQALESSAKTNAKALDVLEESLEVNQRQEEALAKILEALDQQAAAIEAPSAKVPIKQVPQVPTPVQSQAPAQPNRHERRKATAISKKKNN